MSVNDEILNRSIRHSVYLERWTTGQVNAVMRILDRSVIPELRSTLRSRLERITSRGYDTGVWTTKRYKEMISIIGTQVKTGIKFASRDFNLQLRELAIAESRWQLAMLSDSMPIDIAWNTPSLPVLRSLVTSKPMQGRFLREWWSGLGSNAKSLITKEVNIGIVLGEGTEKIVRRVMGTASASFGDGALNQIRNNARAVVRTAVSHIAHAARHEVIRENDAVVKGERWVAVLDARTTDICGSLDGQFFKLSDGPVPPMHMQCRSVRVPVLKSWRELGINARELSPGTRASVNGQVPQKLTYEKWLRQQNAATQNDILGTGRARLFRQRKLPLDKFVDRNYHSLSLRELEGT